MDEELRKGLEKAGYVVGDAEDLLELDDQERQLLELRVGLSRAFRNQRLKHGLTQAQVAKVMKTSQPIVSKIEAAAPGVSLDLMVRGFICLGGTAREVFSPHPAPGQATSAR
jgi:predicted XRE-type DNA-binding protein